MLKSELEGRGPDVEARSQPRCRIEARSQRKNGKPDSEARSQKLKPEGMMLKPGAISQKSEARSQSHEPQEEGRSCDEM